MRKNSIFLLFIFLTLAAILSACSQTVQVQTPDETRLLINTVHDYSVRFPAEYDVAVYSKDGVAILKKSMLNREDARCDIFAFPSYDLTNEQAVAEYTSTFPNYEPQSSPLAIDGVPAVMLDRVPGQELTRVVLVTYEDTLLKINFTPADPEQKEAYKAMEALYNTVIKSLDFDPSP